MKELYYVGQKFYWKSRTAMSSIYEVGTNTRYDFGFMEHDLEAGEEIHVRPANAEEMALAEERLARS